MELPPAGVGDRLVLVGVVEVVQLVVLDLDGEPVGAALCRQAPWKGPRPEHAVLLEPEVEVRLRLAVVVQDERRPVVRHGLRRPAGSPAACSCAGAATADRSAATRLPARAPSDRAARSTARCRAR